MRIKCSSIFLYEESFSLRLCYDFGNTLYIDLFSQGVTLSFGSSVFPRLFSRSTMSPTLTFSAKILSPTWSTRISIYIPVLYPSYLGLDSNPMSMTFPAKVFAMIRFFVSIENLLFSEWRKKKEDAFPALRDLIAYRNFLGNISKFV